jgi:hypothetical protein
MPQLGRANSICLVSLAVALCISTATHADEDHWANTFVSGNPYQIAAKCYAAGMYYRTVWSRADEDRALMEIMDEDPHLNAEIRTSHFGVQPGARLNLFMVVLDEMYNVASEFRRYPLNVKNARAECNAFLNAHGYATFP